MLKDQPLDLDEMTGLFQVRSLRQQAEAARNAVTPEILTRVLAWEDSHSDRKPQKPTLEWLNLARVALAHTALTKAGVSWETAADEIIRALPPIKSLLQGRLETSARKSIIRIRKEFGRRASAIKIKIALDTYKDGCKLIEERKTDRNELERMAASALLAIKASLSP